MIKIQKGTAGTSGKVRVTFSMPAIAGCDLLYLVGRFGEWDESVYPMERTPGGDWSLTLELEAGCTYQYRFRTLDGRWFNDLPEPQAPTRLGLNRSVIISRYSVARSAPTS